MEAKLTQNNVLPKWIPRKLEIIFISKEEYEAFKEMIQTNQSVPNAVYGKSGFQGESREKRARLENILETIGDALNLSKLD